MFLPTSWFIQQKRFRFSPSTLTVCRKKNNQKPVANFYQSLPFPWTINNTNAWWKLIYNSKSVDDQILSGVNQFHRCNWINRRGSWRDSCSLSGRWGGGQQANKLLCESQLGQKQHIQKTAEQDVTAGPVSEFFFKTRQGKMRTDS